MVKTVWLQNWRKRDKTSCPLPAAILLGVIVTSKPQHVLRSVGVRLLCSHSCLRSSQFNFSISSSSPPWCHCVHIRLVIGCALALTAHTGKSGGAELTQIRKGRGDRWRPIEWFAVKRSRRSNQVICDERSGLLLARDRSRMFTSTICVIRLRRQSCRAGPVSTRCSGCWSTSHRR